jgi:uncharacterized protein (TIGR02466 family)
MKVTLNNNTRPLCTLFGVPFLRFQIPFVKDYRQDLIDKAYFLLDKDRHRNKSNVGGFHSDEIGELDWNSFDAGKWFAESVNDRLIQATRLLHNTRNPNINLELTNSWYMINSSGASSWNRPHSHPISYLSGAFYLSAQPKLPGTGTFIAIVENSSLDSFSERSEDVKLVEYVPVEGELVLFPSSTMHMVSPHTADYDRVVISFNTRIKTDDTLS